MDRGVYRDRGNALRYFGTSRSKFCKTPGAYRHCGTPSKAPADSSHQIAGQTISIVALPTANYRIIERDKARVGPYAGPRRNSRTLRSPKPSILVRGFGKQDNTLVTSGSRKDNGACYDGDFVHRLLAGDESAFSQLVADNYAIVHAIAFARLYDAAAADDLAQEVFLRVFLGLPQLTDSLRANACLPASVARATALIAATHAAMSDSARAAELTVSAQAGSQLLQNTGAVWPVPAAWLRGAAAAGVAAALLVTGVALLPTDGTRTLTAATSGNGRTQTTGVQPAVAPLEGWWSGEIDSSQLWYNLRPIESSAGETSYTATMDFGEVIIGMNVSDIVLNGDRLRLHTLGQCIWEGNVGVDQMAGTFTRLNRTTAPLTLKRMAKGPIHKRKYRKEVMLDPRLLAEYEGVYRFGPRTTITITRHSNQLHATCTGQETMEIYPEAKDEFFYRVIDTQFTFKRDQSGEVNGMIMHQAGMDVPSRKEQ